MLVGCWWPFNHAASGQSFKSQFASLQLLIYGVICVTTEIPLCHWLYHREQHSGWSRALDVRLEKVPLGQMLEDIAVTWKPLYEWTSAVQGMKRPHNPHVRFWADLILNPPKSTWSPSSFVLCSSHRVPLHCVVFHFTRVVRASVKAQTDVFTPAGARAVSADGGGFPDGVGGGLMTRSATSLLDYDFGIMSALTQRGKKKTAWFLTPCGTAATYVNGSQLYGLVLIR